MGSLTGQHAVVTGAGRGIGAAIAVALAREGASLSLLGRDRARLEAQAATLGPASQIVTVDIADEASVAAAFASVRARFPRIDILVNNAGQAESAPLGRTSSALWHRMIEVNLSGTFYCCREAIPAMVKQGYGRVINVASTAGLVGYAYVSAYVSAKHGVIGLTRAIALETAKSGVTVNAVCPGYTETDLARDAIANIIEKTGKTEQEARAALTATNPQGRFVQPEEVAQAVLWLCARDAGAMTGQAIPVAGGEVMSR